MSVRIPASILESILAVALFAACAGPGVPPVSQPVAPAALPALDVLNKRLLENDEGLRAEVVELAGDEAFVRFSGIGGVLEGKALRCRVVREPSPHEGKFKLRYRAAYHGYRYNILFRHPLRRGEQWRAVAPEVLNVTLKLRLVRDARRVAAVDAEKLRRLHLEQRASGALDFQRYTRAFWVTRAQQSIAEERGKVKKACGVAPPVRLPLKSVSDKQLLKRGSRTTESCTQLLVALERLCSSKRHSIRALMARLDAIRCLPGDKRTLTLEGKALVLRGRREQPPMRELVLKLRLPSGRTLRQEMQLESTDVCLQGSQRAILAPREKEGLSMLLTRDWLQRELSYGAQKQYVVHGPLRYTRGEEAPRCAYFFDPRFVGVQRRQLQYRSCLRVDRQAKRCTLRCGTRSKKLKLASRKVVAETLRDARFVASPLRRVPHALARDRRGVYYYVDRGRGAKGHGDFRVFIGRRGRMRSQKMVDVVSDSEGQIFETKRGKLRLILSKSVALWIERRRERKLTLVPVKENLPLIYRELGIYWGKRLGTPCDDL